MSRSARSVCAQPGCFAATTANRYCARHQGAAQERPAFGGNAQRSEDAKQWHKMYQSQDWQRLRRSYLLRHPFCVECMPRLVTGRQVDHKVPHKGDVRLFFDEANLQTLCDSHHSAKTMREHNEQRNVRRSLSERHMQHTRSR